MTTSPGAATAGSIAFLKPRGKWRAFDLIPPSTTDAGGQPEDTARSDLHDMLLGSLRMQNVVVLAGSGCSYSAGGPTMQALWGAAVGLPSSQAEDIARLVGYDLKEQNIEGFLSKVEALLQVQNSSDATVFLKHAKQQILGKCRGFLIDSNEQKLEAHMTFLLRLSRRRARDPRLKVFTTNYDLCFEFAAGLIGAVALDGFSFTSPRRYDPRYFSYDIIRRPQGTDDVGRFLEGVFFLHKLHGSVNWARVVNQGEQREWVEQRAQVEPDDACLIYPARGKYQQSFTQPHLESMAQYLAAVREPNTCVAVVGFGFNDDHLSGPLLNAAHSNAHLRIIVVDPEAREKTGKNEGPWRQLADLGGRGEDVWFIAATFKDFAALIPDLKALTPAERLARDIADLSKGSR